MTQVTVFEAKTNLMGLLQMLEVGEEDVIVIIRDGKPIANLTPTNHHGCAPTFLGFKDGAYDIPDDIDTDNDEIIELFGI